MIGIRYTKQIPKNDINSYNKNDSKTLCKVNIKEYRKNIFCHVREIDFFYVKTMVTVRVLTMNGGHLE